MFPPPPTRCASTSRHARESIKYIILVNYEAEVAPPRPKMRVGFATECFRQTKDATQKLTCTSGQNVGVQQVRPSTAIITILVSRDNNRSIFYSIEFVEPWMATEYKICYTTTIAFCSASVIVTQTLMERGQKFIIIIIITIIATIGVNGRPRY